MRLRTGALAVAALCAGSFQASWAQDGKSTGFGVMAALTISKFAEADRGEYVQSRVGLTGGGFATFGLSPRLALQPEVLLMLKGAKFEGTDFGSAISISYVQVPVLAKWRFPPGGTKVKFSPHLYGGGAVGFKVGCTAKFVSGSASSSQTCKEAGFAIKGTEFGVVLGAGIDIGPAVVGARYDLGLTKIGGLGANNGIKTQTFSILAGWTIRASR